MRKKAYIIIIALITAVTGSAMAWYYYWDDMPKKVPVRAKQVLGNYTDDAVVS